MKLPHLSARHAIVLLACSAATAGCGGGEDTPASATASSLPGSFQSRGPVANGLGPSTTSTPANCTPGAVECTSNIELSTCNATGTALNSTACAPNSTCFMGRCIPLSCTAGENLCLGDAVHQCNADGASTSLVVQCAAGQGCDIGTAQCSSNGQTSVNEGQQPALDGLNGMGNSNAANQANDAQGPTIPCTPNLAWCEGTVLNRCSRDGLSIQPTQCAACGDIGGVDGCIDLSCEASQVTCEGPALIGTCSADGLALSTEPCPEGTVCEGAGTCVPVQCDPGALAQFTGGESTVYWFGQGTTQNFGDISCGFGINEGNPNNGDGDSVNGIANGELFGAMNTSDYRDAATCGACVDLEYQGRSVNITIVDECPIDSNPTCTAGHIDLSRGAWNQLTGNAPGTQIFGVNWSFAPCETSGSVTLELKEPDNQYFNEILVRDHRYQVARVEVQTLGGDWVDAQRQRYNYWTPPDGDMGSYRVRVTDINGAVIEEQLTLEAGSQGGSSQFACQ